MATPALPASELPLQTILPPERDVRALDGQPVLVLTSKRVPVSLGKIRVSPLSMGTAGVRVEIAFRTDALECALGVPPARISALIESFDGFEYRHLLPDGDKVWLPHESPREPGLQTAAALIEAFPLPPNCRLGGVAAE